MNIEAKNLSKIYGDGENRVVALDRANLEIVSSDFISIMGPSGPTMVKIFTVTAIRSCRHSAGNGLDLFFSNLICFRF